MDFLNTQTTANVNAILSETKNLDTTSLNTKKKNCYGPLSELNSKITAGPKY